MLILCGLYTDANAGATKSEEVVKLPPISGVVETKGALRAIASIDKKETIKAGQSKDRQSQEILRTWNLVGNMTLRENLEAWSKKESITLKWDTFGDSDWEVGVNHKIEGDFNSALKVVLKAYAAKKVFLKPIFFGNGILLIKQTHARFSDE